MAWISSTISTYAAIFWDFDGVIKESVGVKTLAYVRLFEPFGPLVAARVRQHHECNGGMSRFAKIPLYLEWGGVTPTEAETARYCELFADRVRQAVIDSPWVPGVREYLEANRSRQTFILVTATPQEEIENILRELGIAAWFVEVHGAPVSKRDAISSTLNRLKCPREKSLLIGDSASDHEAATATGVHFLLRRGATDRAWQKTYSGPQCEDFLDG